MVAEDVAVVAAVFDAAVLVVVAAVVAGFVMDAGESRLARQVGAAVEGGDSAATSCYHDLTTIQRYFAQPQKRE